MGRGEGESVGGWGGWVGGWVFGFGCGEWRGLCDVVWCGVVWFGVVGEGE